MTYDTYSRLKRNEDSCLCASESNDKHSAWVTSPKRLSVL